MSGCIFCRIGAREVASQVVHEDEDVVAFKDADPMAPFHVLVVPKRHVRSIAEADAALAGKLATVAAKVAADAGHAGRGYRIVTNVGPDAGQSVDHVHFHVLAGRPMSWPPG